MKLSKAEKRDNRKKAIKAPKDQAPKKVKIKKKDRYYQIDGKVENW